MLTDDDVQSIIARVRGRMAGLAAGDGDTAAALRASDELAGAADAQLGDGIHATVDAAVAAAKAASDAFRSMGLDSRKVIVEAMRAAMLREGERLAYLAHAETGLGRAEDKVAKNLLVTKRTPGTEDLDPQAVTGDQGMMVTEYAPYGVIGSITPTTNPTSTIINNSDGDDRRRQCGDVQRAPRRGEGLRRECPAVEPRHRGRRGPDRPHHRDSASPRWTRPSS